MKWSEEQCLQLCDDDEVVPSFVDFDEVDDASMCLGQLQHVYLVQRLPPTVTASSTLV